QITRQPRPRLGGAPTALGERRAGGLHLLSPAGRLGPPARRPGAAAAGPGLPDAAGRDGPARAARFDDRRRMDLPARHDARRDGLGVRRGPRLCCPSLLAGSRGAARATGARGGLRRWRSVRLSGARLLGQLAAVVPWTCAADLEGGLPRRSGPLPVVLSADRRGGGAWRYGLRGR